MGSVVLLHVKIRSDFRKRQRPAKKIGTPPKSQNPGYWNASRDAALAECNTRFIIFDCAFFLLPAS